MTEKSAVVVWVKRVAIALAVLIVVVVVGGYAYLRHIGILSTPVYETEPPQMPAMSDNAILLLNKTNGFRHIDALPAADALFQKIADNNGWDIYLTDNAATHNADILSRFKLVVWNNVSGDVLTESQRADFKAWIEQGGAFVGVHGTGGDPSYEWDWYPQQLIGAQFTGHTYDPQFQDADVLVVGGDDLTAPLPRPWRIPQEEWYAFDRNPADAGSELLLVLDEASYAPSGARIDGWTAQMEGEHAIAWRHRVGEGKVLYSAIGHQAATYSIPEYQNFLEAALRWAMAEQQTD